MAVHINVVLAVGKSKYCYTVGRILQSAFRAYGAGVFMHTYTTPIGWHTGIESIDWYVINSTDQLLICI